MSLLWPGFLLLLGLIPLMIAAYIWALRRRRRFALRFSSLSLLREALPKQRSWRRHLPFALFLLAFASLIVALSRPAAIASVPTDQTTIILAIDVSLSMRQADVAPTRLEAAQRAAMNFVRQQKSSTQIGIVAFSGFAEMIQPPTRDQEALNMAIESLTLGRRTGIGAGILKSLDAIAEIDQSVAPSIPDTGDPNSQPAPAPVPKGAYAPDIIVLLTDGVSNAGPLPIDAAQQAADRGVRIYTIGFGTEMGDLTFGGGGGGGGFFGGGGQGQQNGGQGQFGGGQYGGFRRGIDEKTLKEIASMTGGDYYAASSASELNHVFSNLPTYLIAKHEVSELSVIFAALGALLAASAILLSMLWRPLPG